MGEARSVIRALHVTLESEDGVLSETVIENASNFEQNIARNLYSYY